jgi:type I restriction enzyme S subunit
MIGSVARVPSSVPSGRLTQDTVKLDFRENAQALSSYLYWLLRTPHYREYCAGRAMGSAVVALSRSDFLSYPVPPANPMRSALVSLLDAIEEKIELNRRMSETLEAMTRTLFKSWFVDIDFPDAGATLDPDTGLPLGWRAGLLSEVAGHPRRGVKASNLSGEPYIALEHMPRRSIALTEWSTSDGLSSGKFAFRKGEILFGKLRPYFHKVGVAPVDGVCSTDIVVVAPKEPRWFGYVVATVSSDDFVRHTDASSTGTKMPRTNWTDMSRYEIAIPTEKVAARFNDLVRPMIDRIVAATHESRTLAALRDTLLPKLIAGELRVKDAEKQVEVVV